MIVAKSFSRTAYETSITLSAYTSQGTHAKSRAEPELKINKPNAFQAISAFSIRKKLHREGTECHLIWNQVVDPSS